MCDQKDIYCVSSSRKYKNSIEFNLCVFSLKKYQEKTRMTMKGGGINLIEKILENFEKIFANGTQKCVI